MFVQRCQADETPFHYPDIRKLDSRLRRKEIEVSRYHVTSDEDEGVAKKAKSANACSRPELTTSAHVKERCLETTCVIFDVESVKDQARLIVISSHIREPRFFANPNINQAIGNLNLNQSRNATGRWFSLSTVSLGVL